MTTYLVDGFNVLHAVVLRGRERQHWWRSDNQERVVRLAEGCASGEVRVVFDAAREDSERFTGPSSVSVEFAPNADDYIVEVVRTLRRDLTDVYVVSSDRPLLDRAMHHGAMRLSPWRFAELCGRANHVP